MAEPHLPDGQWAKISIWRWQRCRQMNKLYVRNSAPRVCTWLACRHYVCERCFCKPPQNSYRMFAASQACTRIHLRERLASVPHKLHHDLFIRLGPKRLGDNECLHNTQWDSKGITNGCISTHRQTARCSSRYSMLCFAAGRCLMARSTLSSSCTPSHISPP